MNIHIETERLLIRDIVIDDAPGIFALDSDSEVLKYIGTPLMKEISEAEKAIARIHEQYEENGIGRWAMIEKWSGEFIGWTGLKLEKEIRDFTYCDLGYRLLRKYWGNGYASESAIASLKHGFDVLGYEEICAAAHHENLASNRILKKIGMEQGESFEFEGILCHWYSKRNERSSLNTAKKYGKTV